MDITFSVENQIINRTDNNAVVSGSKNFLRAVFTLSPTWRTGHTITPVFRVGDKPYTPEMKNGRFLDDENSCIVPPEVLASAGVFFVSIFDETDNVRITANESPVRVIQSGYNTAEPSLTPTPTVYDEILRSLGDIRNKIVPPDWRQNDSEKPDYIKNRPFYKEQTAVDYVTLYAINMDADLQMGFYGKRIGLSVGQTYSVDIVSDTGETTTVDCECVNGAEGFEMPNAVIPILVHDSDVVIYDGVSIGANGSPVVADNAVYVLGYNIASATVHGLKSIDEVIHKIPNAFLDVDNTFDANSQKPQSGKAVKQILDDTINNVLNTPIETDRIADAAVISDKISDGAVGTTKIQQNAVTNEKIADASVSHSKLQEGIVRGKNLEKPISLESIDISTATEVISPRTTASEDAAHPNKRTYFTKMVLFGELVPTEKSEQTLTLFYDRPSNVILNVPVEFSGEYKTEFYFCIELGMNRMLKAECTVVEKNSEMAYESKYYTTGWILSDMRYGYLDNMKLKFGDSATQKFEPGTNIQVYGVTSK